jgi:hypothetical protein
MDLPFSFAPQNQYILIAARIASYRQSFLHNSSSIRAKMPFDSCPLFAVVYSIDKLNVARRGFSSHLKVNRIRGIWITTIVLEKTVTIVFRQPKAVLAFKTAQLMQRESAKAV